MKQATITSETALAKLAFTVLLAAFAVGITNRHCTAADTPPRYSLKDCLEKALLYSPKVELKRHTVEFAEARLDEARAYRYPQAELTVLAGPSPKATGDQLFSEQRNDTIDGLGVFGSVELTAIQPIYTFGKITSAVKAATHGIEVERSRLSQTAAEVVLDVKKYYYGHLASNEGLRLINEIGGYLKGAIDKTERLLEEDTGDVSEVDLYKLRTFVGLLASYRMELKKNSVMSKKAVAAFMGVNTESDFSFVEERLTPVEAPVGELNAYVETGRELRPEFTQLQEGIAAKTNLASMAESDLYPMVFAAAFFSYAEASNRDRVTNPWIYDFFQHKAGGAAVGLRWNIDFGITKAKVHQAEAEVAELKSLRKYALMGIPLEIEKTYRELLKEKESLVELERSSKSARKWLVSASMGYDMGLTESGELADALAAYAKVKEEHVRAVYEYNIKYAELLHVTGLSLKEIQGKY